MPDEDGEDTGKGSGGMGLGEGEGQKDVSERIESEDQLEDAQLPGEREEKDDKDCKVCLTEPNNGYNQYECLIHIFTKPIFYILIVFTL